MPVLLENKLKQALLDYSKTRDEVLKSTIIEYITTADISELRTTLYDALVLPQGKSDTIAGEMIRAVNRIGYRFFNDGEVYFAGYGLETVGSPAIYLSELNPALETLIIKVYPENYTVSTNKDMSYQNFITTLETRVIAIIQKTPELVLRRNTTDSATAYQVQAEETFEVYDEILFGDDDTSTVMSKIFKEVD